MKLDLKVIKAAAQAAGGRQWVDDGDIIIYDEPGELEVVGRVAVGPMDSANAAHISAACPAAVLELVARLERAERERDSYKRALLDAPRIPDGTVCKGAMLLGSGCGRCRRCREEMGAAT